MCPQYTWLSLVFRMDLFIVAMMYQLECNQTKFKQVWYSMTNNNNYLHLSTIIGPF